MESPEQKPSDALEAETVGQLLEALARRPAGEGRLDRWAARGTQWAYRATTWGPLAPAAEVAWRAFRRDSSIAGSVLGAAIAYRIFVWLLPIALVFVALAGLVSDVGDYPPEDIVDAGGIGGYFAASIASAVESTTVWASITMLAVGGFFTLYETFVLLRAFRAVASLAWALQPRPVRRPVRATLVFLGLTFGCVLAASAIGPIREHLEAPLDWIALAGSLCLAAGYWLAVSYWLLPSRDTRVLALLPGSVLFGVGLGALQFFNAFILFPWITQKAETYGVLGVAAGLLFSFFVLGRIVAFSAALNAVLAEGRAAREAGGAAAT